MSIAHWIQLVRWYFIGFLGFHLFGVCFFFSIQSQSGINVSFERIDPENSDLNWQIWKWTLLNIFKRVERALNWITRNHLGPKYQRLKVELDANASCLSISKWSKRAALGNFFNRSVEVFSWFFFLISRTAVINFNELWRVNILQSDATLITRAQTRTISQLARKKPKNGLEMGWNDPSFDINNWLIELGWTGDVIE